MTRYLFTNNATSTLQNATAAGSISITVPTGEGAKFPSPNAGNAEVSMLAIEDRRSKQLEFVTLTARSGDVLTVTRAQEGTTAQNFVAGALVSQRLTAQTMADIQTQATPLPEAPINGLYYVRRNGAWFQSTQATTVGTIPDAPSDNSYYTRRNAAWVVQTLAALGGVPEAPNDSNQYARVSAGWARLDSAQVLYTGIAATVKLALDSIVATNTAQDTTISSKAATTYVDAQVATKASVSYVDAADALKASITYVDGSVNGEASTRATADTNLTNTKVAKAGDTMTGTLAIAPTSGVAQLTLNKPTVAAPAIIYGLSNGSSRWRLALGNGNPESGGNVGSDFSVTRFDDSGITIDNPLNIDRSSGLVTGNLVTPSALAHRSGAGAIALGTSAWTKLNLATLGANAGGWTLSTQNLIVPKNGIYLVGASLQITMAAAIGACEVGVGLNSTTVPFMRCRTLNANASSSAYIINTQRLATLNAGDALSLLGFSGPAGAQVQDGTDVTYLWATMVAAQ